MMKRASLQTERESKNLNMGKGGITDGSSFYKDRIEWIQSPGCVCACMCLYVCMCIVVRVCVCIGVLAKRSLCKGRYKCRGMLS